MKSVESGTGRFQAVTATQAVANASGTVAARRPGSRRQATYAGR